jgi:hypothetical protein
MGPGYWIRCFCFPVVCRAFTSGGTRIRTGDTMIFSSVAYLLPRVAASDISLYVSCLLYKELER